VLTTHMKSVGEAMAIGRCFAEALQKAFAYPGPALVDVAISKHELAMPPKVELAQAKGFSLYMLRAILNGRGDEIVELAKTNFR